MKPRDFWICLPDKENYNDSGSVALDPDEFTTAAQAECIHVREVVKIDWDKVWETFSQQGECGLYTIDEEMIQELVEKQLNGD